MKPLCFIAALILLCSCTKEKFTEPLSGTWTIIETNMGTGAGYTIQSYTPSSEMTIEFGPGGNLLLTGANPGLATSPLWEYNRYQLLQNNTIRFYQANGAKSTEAFVTVNGELYLNYLWAGNGYEEKFVKIK